MEIHPIKTGTVEVKTRQREGHGVGRRRFLNTLVDREWTDPLPILAWAIAHPEGLIVVDTGETARAMDEGYFPGWHPYFRLGLRETVTPEDEIGPQLRGLGFDPADVRWVVMTHLHTDHAGGLHHFPSSEILVTRAELDYAAGPAQPRLGTMSGINVALRAVMETGIVAGLAYWGFTTGASEPAKIGLGVAAPLIGFGFWGAVDFRSAGRYAELLRLIQELVISGLAALAWYSAGQQALGWALVVLALVHHALVYVLGQRLVKDDGAARAA